MDQKELKINIAPDKAQGVFANLALIAHTPTEFVLDFAQMMPGIQQANVVARVVVTPDQAKKNPRCIAEQYRSVREEIRYYPTDWQSYPWLNASTYFYRR